MMDFVKESLEDADVVLFITDNTETYMDDSIVSRLTAIKVPLIIVINKVDLSMQDEVNKLVHGWKKKVY